MVVARTDFSKIRRPLAERHPDWAYPRDGWTARSWTRTATSTPASTATTSPRARSWDRRGDDHDPRRGRDLLQLGGVSRPRTTPGRRSRAMPLFELRRAIRRTVRPAAASVAVTWTIRCTAATPCSRAGRSARTGDRMNDLIHGLRPGVAIDRAFPPRRRVRAPGVEHCPRPGGGPGPIARRRTRSGRRSLPAHGQQQQPRSTSSTSRSATSRSRPHLQLPGWHRRWRTAAGSTTTSSASSRTRPTARPSIPFAGCSVTMPSTGTSTRTCGRAPVRDPRRPARRRRRAARRIRCSRSTTSSSTSSRSRQP